MKRIINWIEAILARAKALMVTDPTGDPENVETGDDNDHVSAQSVVMPDIYADHKTTNPRLKVVDLSSPDSDETRGFNPYDTGGLKKR